MHWRAVPQEPVLHDPLPFLSKSQWVRAHIRPCQVGGAVKTADWVGLKAKPPRLKLFGVIPGHIVSLQLFMMVKFVEFDELIPVVTNIIREFHYKILRMVHFLEISPDAIRSKASQTAPELNAFISSTLVRTNTSVCSEMRLDRNVCNIINMITEVRGKCRRIRIEESEQFYSKWWLLFLFHNHVIPFLFQDTKPTNPLSRLQI